MEHVTIYTDGSWKAGVHSGGWSCLMVSGPHWQVLSGNTSDTTISRMELTAVITALESLKTTCLVTVISDSMYVVKSINEWIKLWSLNDWRTSKKTLVENLDLIQRLDAQMRKHQITAKWIKSHTGRKEPDYLGNNCVDWFAQHNADLFR